MNIDSITYAYEAKEDRMKKYLKLTNRLISHFDDVRIEQVLKEENSEADEVTRLALSTSDKGKTGLHKEM